MDKDCPLLAEKEESQVSPNQHPKVQWILSLFCPGGPRDGR